MLQTRAYEQIRSISSFLDRCGFHCASGQVGAEDAAQIFPPFLGLQEYLLCVQRLAVAFEVGRQHFDLGARQAAAHGLNGSREMRCAAIG